MVCDLNILYIIYFVLLVEICLKTNAEFFSATTDLEYLMDTHESVIEDLDYYIHEEEKRLFALKRLLNIYQREHKKMEDISSYLANPINAFTLVKRLTADLDIIKDSIEAGTEFIKHILMENKNVKFPTSVDLIGTVRALSRLQETYKLTAHKLANGNLNGVAFNSSMTASDCYMLGKVLYEEDNFVDAQDWMVEAFRKYNKEKLAYPFTDIDIMEYIINSYHMSGDMKSALHWTKKLLKIQPENAQAKNLLPSYRKSIAEDEARVKGRSKLLENGTDRRDKKSPKMKRYEELCRRDMKLPIKISSRLLCRYMTENHPFLTIAPIKMEMKYVNPDIVLFHEVLSNNEIEIIKQVAKPLLERASVYNPKTGQPLASEFRVSKSTVINNLNSDVVARISTRIVHMTGLSVETAEDIQVINYGIGGHYVPHYDFTPNTPISPLYGDNRIATVMFYMSDVAQGGATVFLKLGLIITPVKGAAAFWYNLNSAGEGDFATLHAACPVLEGSKWVANRWLHEKGQEFYKPCRLKHKEGGINNNNLRLNTFS